MEESAIADGGVTCGEVDRMAEFQNPSVSRAATSRPKWTPPLMLLTPHVSLTRGPLEPGNDRAAASSGCRSGHGIF